MPSCPCRCGWCIMIQGGITFDGRIPEAGVEDPCWDNCNHKNCHNCK